MDTARSGGRSSDGPEYESLFDRARAAGVSPVAACLVALGAALILAGFSVLDWFRSGAGFFAGAGSSSTFAEVRDTLAHTKQQVDAQGLSGHVTFGASYVYFEWLGWVLLVIALGTGAVAVSRFGGRHWSVRFLAAVAAAAGVGVTVLALDLITFERNAPNNANAPTYGDFLRHSGLGAWAAVAGFLLILVGDLLPRRGL